MIKYILNGLPRRIRSKEIISFPLIIIGSWDNEEDVDEGLNFHMEASSNCLLLPCPEFQHLCCCGRCEKRTDDDDEEVVPEDGLRENPMRIPVLRRTIVSLPLLNFPAKGKQKGEKTKGSRTTHSTFTGAKICYMCV